MAKMYIYNNYKYMELNMLTDCSEFCLCFSKLQIPKVSIINY